jgi:DNA polymerase (family 10)
LFYLSKTMLIDNDHIASQFALLAKLMDIHGENSFKTRSYSVAAYTIERLPGQLTDLPPEKLLGIKGIGDAIGKKIRDIIDTGELKLLRQYIENTPPGIIEMLGIKGLGPKKIATIWKEMGIESVGELLYACQENRLLLYKGFGEKTQNNVKETIEFYFRSQGSHLYADVETYALSIHDRLKENFKTEKLALTGEFNRQLEVINQLEWVTTIPPDALSQFLGSNGFTAEAGGPDGEGITATPADATAFVPGVAFKGAEGIRLVFFFTPPADFDTTLFQTSCSEAFLEAWKKRGNAVSAGTEGQIFASAGMQTIPPCLREDPAILDAAAANALPDLIQTADIRGVIHSHSNWSDGSNTLEEMARACMDKGYEYLVISDHSKSAFYANGLKEDRIKEQHLLVDELNQKLAPFTIFKSIESDILNDGALDYSDSILSTFDLVIASVHSNLKMSEEKAMMRLLNAINNPYTTILGHPTGRLLLSRPGYPVDHKKIIDACAENKIVIELNAHPRRLDMDWRWIGYAIERGVLISIDPDAHSTEGIDVNRYGVLAAQKAGLTRAGNLSSYTLEQFKAFLTGRKK